MSQIHIFVHVLTYDTPEVQLEITKPHSLVEDVKSFTGLPANPCMPVYIPATGDAQPPTQEKHSRQLMNGFSKCLSSLRLNRLRLGQGSVCGFGVHLWRWSTACSGPPALLLEKRLPRYPAFACCSSHPHTCTHTHTEMHMHTISTVYLNKLH